MNPVITSFYTPTWTYPEHAERLRGECDELGLDHHIVERPDLGGYLANCRQKPLHLLETMRLGRPLLWVDVDGSVLRTPENLPTEDFAAVPMAPERDRTWHVGTILFAPTAAARDLLQQWVDALDDVSSDEAALERVWRAGRWYGTYAELPTTYLACGIYRDVPDPVVMHRLSASPAKRVFRRGL